MNLLVVGCNYHNTPLELRERLAFTADQAAEALRQFQLSFPRTEAVLLSTCNRVELYTAQEEPERAPSHEQLAEFLADFHRVPLERIFDVLFEHNGSDMVRHLFLVATSLDSMVIGEPQIVAQVKDAYQLAQELRSAGPLTHALFQQALAVAKRVRTETGIADGRVSVPSVAVGEFATGVFDRFDDKTVLVIGAGEMAEETLTYLRERGMRRLLVVSRSAERGESLAERWDGTYWGTDRFDEALAAADLIVSATAAPQKPLVTAARFRPIRARQHHRPVLVLDLAVPRDFEPAVGDLENVYLYSIDDLQRVCERNRTARQQEREQAIRVVEAETEAFMAALYHRATGPIVGRLKREWKAITEEELKRLYNKIGHLRPDDRAAIEQAFHRVVNKLLHPPLAALRDEAKKGAPHGLLEALKRLFRIE